MAAPVEREVKLGAPEEFALPSLAGLDADVQEGPPVRLALDAVYYDSADLALARSGVTLRYRTGEPGPPWTLKLPGGADRTTLTRTELRFDGDAERVPSAALDLVRAYLRARRVRPVAALHTDRTCVLLAQSDGAPVAEVVDDRVTVRRSRQPANRFREVEIESKDAGLGARVQNAARKRLLAAGCRVETPRPKLIRAVGERAREPADLVVPQIGKKATVDELVRFVLARSTERIIRHDAGVRLGEDPEDLHQFRVAARTLRSDLKTFASVLDQDWAASLRSELGWLGTEVGRVRDLDVLEQRLRRRLAELPTDDAEGSDMLEARIVDEREAARESMLAALRSARFDALLNALIDAAREPRFGARGHGEARALPLARRAAHSQLRRLDKAVHRAGREPTDAELHRIRIQAKRTRYAMDAARPIVGRPAAKHAAAVAGVQTVLGDLHDTVVAQHWLREAARERPACGVAAGQLIAAERIEHTRLRGTWRKAWAAANAKGLGTWLRA